MNRTYRAYRATVDGILLNGTVDDLNRLMLDNGMTPDHGVTEVTFHKVITANHRLPIEHRMKSKAWLTERGFHSLDDGELSEVR